MSRVSKQDISDLPGDRSGARATGIGDAYAQCGLDRSKLTVYKTNVGKRIQVPPPPPPESGKGKKPEKRSPEKELVSALLAPVEDSRALMQVVLTLPKAHIRVLDTEAAMLGLRRYQFIELLFLSELGQAILTRPSYMQSYQFVRSEISETQRVLIYFRPEVKKLFDEYLARQGLRPSSWVAMALRNWAHLDDALRAVK